MKFLRNPVVTACLAVLAVGVVLYQVLGANLFKRRPSGPPAQVAAATPATPAPAPARNQANKAAPNGRSATSSNSEAASLPNATVDAAVVERGFKAWVAAPLRDPFWLLQPVIQQPGLFATETNSPVATWTLNAIMNQTDSRLAVIEDQVYRVGDVIEGYKLIRIEQDEVWLQGPTRNERLGFAKPRQGPPSAPGKGQPKAKAKKTKA